MREGDLPWDCDDRHSVDFGDWWLKTGAYLASRSGTTIRYAHPLTFGRVRLSQCHIEAPGPVGNEY